MHFVIDICSENVIRKGVCICLACKPKAELSSYYKSNKCPSEHQLQGASGSAEVS